MNSFRRFRCLPVLLLGTVLAWAGCKDVFVPKIKVSVDAISAAGTPKPAGQSFKLVGKRSVVIAQRQVDVLVVAACVKAALAQQGMYEAPEKVPPEIFIEVNYGVEATTRSMAATRESYLQLSARRNEERDLERTRGPEVWDVRTAIAGYGGRFEDALPLLATMAAESAGANTQMAITKEVPQNLPAVATVREAAMREINEKAAANKPPAPAATTNTPAPPAPPAGAK